MNFGLSPPGRWSILQQSLAIAFLSHILLIAIVGWLPSLKFVGGRERTEVRFIRLRGGGESRPGWIRPTTAPPDEARVPTGKPKEVETAESKPKRTEPPKPQPAEEEALPKKQAVVEVPEVKEEAVTAADKASEPEAAVDAVEEGEESAASVAATTTPDETGEGVGRKPGPEGPGMGVRSDADFPGADAYLSRIEAEIQRRFNFRGRGTGVIAEYHFFIQKNGKIVELILMKSSGIASLDLSARSSILRAKLPPLPGGFGHPRLGVTYLFHDAR